ncbi:MAG: hypothetical protein K2H98_06675, partial [Duncaniella sp.]|nr:hypothetical protein [Duncaniella sp.]
SKPIVFDISLTLLNDTGTILKEYSVAKIWELLNRIEDACIAVSSPQKTAETEVTPTGYSMPGIWIDDADEGRSRFWIFPENKLMAFCYTESDSGWVMAPYEFAFFCRRGEKDFDDSCVFITARGNEQIINNADSIMDQSEIVSATFICSGKDDNGLIGKISFSPESGECPEWFDWRSFRRLHKNGRLHSRFMRIVSDIYNPASPLSVLFHNTAPFLTDEMDCLIGVDNDYIYLWDAPQPDRFVLRCDVEDAERFWYEPVYHVGRPGGNLREAVMGPQHPMYILPRFTDLDKHISERHRRFAEACRNVTIDSQITIYHTPRHPQGILCFNNFSVVFPLDDDCAELKQYGVVKVTDRSQLFE